MKVKFMRIGDMMVNVNDIASICKKGKAIEVTHIGGQVKSNTCFENEECCKVYFNEIEKEISKLNYESKTTEED